MSLRARPTLTFEDDDETDSLPLSDVTGMVRRPLNRRAERRRLLVVRVVAGCDELTYAQLPLDRPMVIGRDPTCDLVIDHASVSRRHATVALEADTERVTVTDLGSTNGTWIGATPIVGATSVDAGDRVGFGYVTVRIEPLAEEELSHLDRVAKKLRSSGVDPLTGLLSRGWLQEDLPQLVADHLKEGAPLTAVFLDIDHFKSINDTFGHAAGDAVLKVVGTTLTESIRTSDVAVRYGGEEFLLVLRRTNGTVGVVIAERVRKAMLAIPWADHGLEGRVVTISCGVAELRADEDAAAWLKRADDALYDAKSGGRNRVVRVP